MPLQLVSAPAGEPITLLEAKQHLRVDVDDDDALIGSLITAARQAAETRTGRQLMTARWKLVLDANLESYHFAYAHRETIAHLFHDNIVVHDQVGDHQRIVLPKRSFAELAERYSACPSKAQGGSLGQISKGQTVPELERQLFTLQAGLAAKPLESRYGWHVISVDQRIDGQPLPYEAVATAIRTQLQQGVWQKALVQYLQTLIGAADIRGIRLQGADSPLVQ